MCGISGLLHSDPARPVDPALLAAMTDALLHRGPDERGLWCDGPVGLGHRRLSIIDLSSGQQPMHSADGHLTIVFNGEIYNFPALRQRLEREGCVFRTHSDTEVILHGYAVWGDAVLHELNGMFAFAIWDAPRRRLFMARDRLGKKPLYYRADGQRLHFASELKGILADPSVPRRINAQAVDAFFSLRCVPAPLSIYQDIHKLPPAHSLIWQQGNIQIQPYWTLNARPEAMDEDEARQQLDSLLKQATAERMMSEVPLGAFLSGGVDSSLVVAYMSQLSGRPVKTCAVGFSEDAYDETPYAREVARLLHTEHHEEKLQSETLDHFGDVLRYFDEPFADASALPTFQVCQMARKHVTVALSGDGGDESFAGYQRRYHVQMRENRYRQMLPSALRKAVFGPLAAIYPQGAWLPRWARLQGIMQNLSHDFEAAWWRDASTFLPEQKRAFYGPAFGQVSGWEAMTGYQAILSDSADADVLTRLLQADTRITLPEAILVKVDRMSMANSLEVRSPLLDYRVAELAARMPSALKLNGAESKYILKKVAEDYLPKNILYRPKQGFNAPIPQWLCGPARPWAEDLLRSFRERGWLRPEAVDRLWQDFLAQRQDYAVHLWCCLTLELWHEQCGD